MRPRLLDERGVAMTEALIVIPFLLVIWLAVDALHGLFAARLAVQATAQALALERSIAGSCGEVDRSLEDTAETAGVGQIDAESASLIDTIAGVTPFVWSHATARVEQTVPGLPEWAGGPTGEVGGRARLMCNMAPVEGLVDLATRAVGGMLGL